MRSIPCLAFTLTLALAAAGPAFAKPDKGGGGHGHGPKGDQGYEDHGGGSDNDRGGGPDTHISVGIHIGDDDRHVIRSYYDEHRFEAKRLPPGIAKNLARGKPLPPGIAKRYLPGDLVRRLPERPGCDWLVVGVDAVLFDRHSGVVVDIAADIFL